MKVSQSTRKLTVMGMMAAISVLLVYLIRFPLLPAAAFLEYEPADIPIYICTFLYGPLSGFVLTIIVSLVQGVTVSAGSGIIGIVMHIFSTGSFALIAGFLYRRKKDTKTAIISLLAGIIVMTVMMCILNLILTPIFMGVPRDAVLQMIVPIIIPFNLLKAGINSLVTLITYKKIGYFALKNLNVGNI